MHSCCCLPLGCGVQVLGGPSCLVRITSLDEDWVRVQAVAIVPYTNNVMHTPVDIGAIEVKYNGTAGGGAPPLGHRRRLHGKSLPHWARELLGFRRERQGV
jgi:hypothetical protein